MKNTALLFLPLLVIVQSLFAQQKGAAPIINHQSPITGTTRAVVIGISDYQDDAIPDLRFADKDAEAFSTWLRSPAGGSLTNDQIVLLTNAKATLGQFSAALDWLIEQCKEGEQAIIYFSGHGDVETKTIMNLGFLLTFNSPPTNYIAGAFPIFYLQSVVATLSQKGVRVVVITDACRAGKLAGSEFGGTQATALNLSKQFANEVKIMSCQPDEFSMEGEQWGGGRGAFSFHLVEGLTGMADKNADGKVQLLEIENYLEDILPKETAPQSQIPMTVGNKSSMVTLVDVASLAQLKQRKATEMPNLAKVETKGFEETVLEKADTSVQELYAAFLAAVERGDLLEPAGKSANDYYERLMLEESLAALHGFMKRNLAAALHDEAQVALNLYLSTDKLELQKRSQLDSSYFRYPKYLSRAADLLGEGHYMYRNLRGKQSYFEGLLVRLTRDFLTATNNVPWDTAMTAKALELQHKALEFETRAAFIYHELANLYRGNGSSIKALEYSKKSADLSPNWALTLQYYGNDLLHGAKKFEEAIEVYKKALQVAPHYKEVYASIGFAYWGAYRYSEAASWFDKAVEHNPDRSWILANAWSLYSTLSNFDKCEALARKIVALPPANKWEGIYTYDCLGTTLFYQKKNEDALRIFTSLTVDTTQYSYHNWLVLLGLTKINLGRNEEGLADIQTALRKNPENLTLKIMAGQGFLKLKQHTAATNHFNLALQQMGKLDLPWKLDKIYEIAWACAYENEPALALHWLETILKEGYDDYERLQLDRVLADVRNTQQFKDLMKKYFPDQVKD